ncbi:hypothetical protein OIU84_006960 [Salix udensis]|uniref:Uncharacterized protein n=1 Tax=Salix udensis TaxID=889485 RepID=A0AAD6P300_9ROSI|nr:hypothetical protein OIU84_006960 [Salix udensis]
MEEGVGGCVFATREMGSTEEFWSVRCLHLLNQILTTGGTRSASGKDSLSPLRWGGGFLMPPGNKRSNKAKEGWRIVLTPNGVIWFEPPFGMHAIY